ncbi:MAG: hypothetical protein NUV91_06470 [Candidatus Omnitrophica bacterium]|nr:hypothetical protein [Candidatus Omnitrophota bacterium]
MLKKIIKVLKNFLGVRPARRKAKRRSPRSKISILKKKKKVSSVRLKVKKSVPKKQILRISRKASSSVKKKLNSSKKKPIPDGSSKKDSSELIGEVTHYFPKIMVCVVKVQNVAIRVRDEVLIRGKNTDFKLKVSSLQIESQDVAVATKGKLVGLKLNQQAHVGDKIYKCNG